MNDEISKAAADKINNATPPGAAPTYGEFVDKLCKSGVDIVNSLNPWRAHIMHMAIGVSGEAGELLDAVKKAVIYEKPIDKDNVIEELGDLEFYMQGVRNAMGVSRDEIIAHNKKKLSKRYVSLHYSDMEAQARADKEPEKISPYSAKAAMSRPNEEEGDW